MVVFGGVNMHGTSDPILAATNALLQGWLIRQQSRFMTYMEASRKCQQKLYPFWFLLNIFIDLELFNFSSAFVGFFDPDFNFYFWFVLIFWPCFYFSLFDPNFCFFLIFFLDPVFFSFWCILFFDPDLYFFFDFDFFYHIFRFLSDPDFWFSLWLVLLFDPVVYFLFLFLVLFYFCFWSWL